MSWARTFSDAKDPSDWAYITCAVCSCGYSQPNRDHLSVVRLLQGTAETDCSYGVNWWYYKAGYLKECIGFSTRTEIDYLVSLGWRKLDPDTTEPKRNDALWRQGHTAMYIGDGLQAEALRTERGDAGYSGSTPGDQDGGETIVRAYPAGGWTWILRPPAQEPPMLQGWQKAGGYWYYYVDGAPIKAKWHQEPNGDWYYFRANGTMATGYDHAGTSDWYYFDETKGHMGVMLKDQPAKHHDGWCWCGPKGIIVQSGTMTIKKGIMHLD